MTEPRQCPIPGCKESWPVFRNGRRKLCSRHQAAVRRKAAREAQAAKRQLRKDDLAAAQELFSGPWQTITEFAIGLYKAGVPYEEAKRLVRKESKSWYDVAMVMECVDSEGNVLDPDRLASIIEDDYDD